MLEGFPRKSFIKKTFFIFLVHYGHHIFSEAKKDTYNVKNSFSKHRFQEIEGPDRSLGAFLPLQS